VQTLVGLVCVLLGCMHLADRDRTPYARSFYFGSARSSHTVRASLAIIEVTCGFALLFTA
jgi:hypothetical protein